MRSSIYFLLAFISSAAFAAPTLILKREAENSQTTGFDPSLFRIGTVVLPSNPHFGIGPEIPSSPALAEPTLVLKREGENSQTTGFDPSLFRIGTVVLPSTPPLLGIGPEIPNLSISKRAAQDLSDDRSNFVNAFAAEHPNYAFTRDTSEQDRLAQLLDNLQNSHDIFMRDAGNQALWDLLIKWTRG
ncbi:hypothetical protein BC827DRAFT_1250798 [Russula dissimulans]|nr:hypothetical protein BC827DRAFT_1250798 [Russula dissimulans]